MTTRTGSAYHDAFEALTHVVLEESWVLALDATVAELVFRLDLVLTPRHPHYRRPAIGEVGCYRKAVLRIHSDQGIHFEPASTPPARDATGEFDLGHIDTFAPAGDVADRAWEMSGDWGRALVRLPEVDIDLDG